MEVDDFIRDAGWFDADKIAVDMMFFDLGNTRL